MSVVDPSVENLETIVNNVQQLRLARLSALVMLLWDHSMCSFPMSKCLLAAKRPLPVISLDKEVHCVKELVYKMWAHIDSPLD